MIPKRLQNDNGPEQPCFDFSCTVCACACVSVRVYGVSMRTGLCACVVAWVHGRVCARRRLASLQRILAARKTISTHCSPVNQTETCPIKQA